MAGTVTVNGDLYALADNLYRENLSGYSHGFTLYSIGGNNLYMGNYQSAALKPRMVSSTSYQGVTKAHFLDGDLILSPTAGETLVFALYDGAFNRAADTSGLAYWAPQVDAGVSLKTLGRAFEASPEFALNYSTSLDNSQFVTAVYQNVLDRAPDQGGFEANIARLESGFTRGEVVATLVASSAYPTAVFVPKSSAGAIAEIYDTFLGRLPDKAGLAHWIHAADAGVSLQSIADGFANSPEFTTKYAGTTDAAYVQALYQNTLHRDAEAAGFVYWTDQLEHGHSRAEVALGFALSPEHGALTRSHVDDGLYFH